jgi:hypothetical protein
MGRRAQVNPHEVLPVLPSSSIQRLSRVSPSLETDLLQSQVDHSIMYSVSSSYSQTLSSGIVIINSESIVNLLPFNTKCMHLVCIHLQVNVTLVLTTTVKSIEMINYHAVIV